MQFKDVSLPVEQPNFDNEQTVLSAQPVVPLANIDAKERRLRRWVLGGAFAIAMMLGAASALLASYLKLRNVPNTTTEILEVEASAEPLAVAPEPVASESPVVDAEEVENAEQESASPSTPKKAPAARRRAIPSRDTDLMHPRAVRGRDEEEGELQRIREAVLIDAWEERRARRTTRRERRNRVDHHDRDLSNLNEIFEGQRRRP